MCMRVCKREKIRIETGGIVTHRRCICSMFGVETMAYLKDHEKLYARYARHYKRLL